MMKETRPISPSRGGPAGDVVRGRRSSGETRQRPRRRLSDVRRLALW